MIYVGHNALAAEAIKKALYPQKFVLVYNTFADKDYEKILTILRPIIEAVAILPLEGERVVAKEELQRVLTQLKIQYYDFETIERVKNYLVFGSFSVVEEFLKRFDA